MHYRIESTSMLGSGSDGNVSKPYGEVELRSLSSDLMKTDPMPSGHLACLAEYLSSSPPLSLILSYFWTCARPSLLALVGTDLDL